MCGWLMWDGKKEYWGVRYPVTRSCQIMVDKVGWDRERKRKLRFEKSKDKKSTEVKWRVRGNAPHLQTGSVWCIRGKPLREVCSTMSFGASQISGGAISQYRREGWIYKKICWWLTLSWPPHILNLKQTLKYLKKII